MKSQSSIFGFLCIFLGIVLFFLAAGYLLVRCVLALAGLTLINYGLKLQGSTPLQYRAYHWFNRSQFRGW